MNCQEIIEELKEQASEKHKAGVVKLGIPEENSIGVSTTVVRNFAKKIGTSKELAFDLWDTGYHEAKLLAVLLFPPKALCPSDIQRLMTDVTSWDLCDHLCKNLVMKLEQYECIIFEWVDSPQLYEKRAAFTLIASAAIHEKELSTEALDTYLALIYENAADERDHVKKAISWALREIGKINFAYREKALLVARGLMESGGKGQVWIAKDARKELENLVKADGRKRLISRNTQMGSV